MNDLAQLSTSTLLEDLAKHHRYEDRLRKSLGHEGYYLRRDALREELISRGLKLDALPPRTAPPPRHPCRLTPLSDHVVVLPAEAATISEGGIVIPDTAKETPMQGEVLAVGPGRIEPNIGTVVPAVSIGDVVLFGRYSGISVTLDDTAVLIMREEDVLGVLQPKDGE